MLLHETVKGIYELISAAALPSDDAEKAETIIANTDSLADELEDLRFGPEMAADLRDYINGFKEANKIKNLQEYVFGEMMRMPARDFLELFSGILSGTTEAKVQVQEIIDGITEMLSDYEMQKAGLKDDSDYEDDDEDYPTPDEEEAPAPVPQSEDDYENMSQRELQELIDKYLDARDYTNPELTKITKYIKESKQAYVANKINECMNNNMGNGYY
jgi:archaellum component FlaC